jgi:hypothetical protein
MITHREGDKDNREVLANELSEAQERDNATLIACRIGARPYDGRF